MEINEIVDVLSSGDPKEIEKKLNEAKLRAQSDPDMIKKAADDPRAKALFDSLPAKDAAKVKAILSDPKLMRAVLSSPGTAEALKRSKNG